MATRKSSKHHTTAQDQHPAGPGTLALDEDSRFHRAQWRAERIGWVAMLAIVIGALAGVSGSGGPLTRTTAATADGSSEVQYARFARYSAPTTLEVNVAAAESGSRIRLRVSEEYLDAMTVRSITPPPVSTTLAERQYVFVFERSPTPAVAKIQLQLEPTAFGPTQGWLAVDNGAPILFTQFIYP